MHTIPLTKDFEEMFQFIANKTGRPLEDLVHEALDHFLEAWEDQQDAEEAQQLYRAFKESGEQGVSFDEVLKSAGLTRADLQ